MMMGREDSLWFAIQVRSRRERAVARSLESKAYEYLLPLYERRRRLSDRVTTVEEPLFPGYLFCRLQMGHGPKIVTTPGVVRIVGFGAIPIPVEETEIQAVRLIVESGLGVAPHPYLQIGQAVRLLRGPLAGLEGVLLRVGNGHRLVVSVSILQRSVAVEVDDRWVALQDSSPMPARMVELGPEKRLLGGRCA